MSTFVSESAVIGALNDNLRKFHHGGLVVISRGIAALDRQVWAAVITAVAAFDSFNEGNDPYGERDCAVVQVDGLSVIWKIDCFDPTLLHHSDDSTNPKITKRVMTIMLAEEY